MRVGALFASNQCETPAVLGMPMDSREHSEWIETTATVVSCKFQFARMNTMSLGLQRDERFRIAFDYYAHGQLYSGEFQSPVAMAQNKRIPIRYNPQLPGENSYSDRSGSAAGRGLFAVAIAGSVVLSLVWLLAMRGCS